MSDTFRGHRITEADGVWTYDDTGGLVSDDVNRACGHCDKENTPEGHDGCIGTLRGGVMNACCGHGTTAAAYVQFRNGSSVHGEAALRVMEQRRSMPPPSKPSNSGAWVAHRPSQEPGTAPRGWLKRLVDMLFPP